ncbi:MAG: hypothetical protein A2W84_11855 [Bacteroidetes bacterium GWC2_40_13]|jgi:hypothetical protein|nr:MAG: hypothetical protein A2W84_11855 [Bacteroidetes bacterium GWC2_40_13]
MVSARECQLKPEEKYCQPEELKEEKSLPYLMKDAIKCNFLHKKEIKEEQGFFPCSFFMLTKELLKVNLLHGNSQTIILFLWLVSSQI